MWGNVFEFTESSISPVLFKLTVPIAINYKQVSLFHSPPIIDLEGCYQVPRPFEAKGSSINFQQVHIDHAGLQGFC